VQHKSENNHTCTSDTTMDRLPAKDDSGLF
jgi:hypothetical protein